MAEHAGDIVKSGKKVSGPAGTASQRAMKSKNKGRETDASKMAKNESTRLPHSQGS